MVRPGERQCRACLDKLKTFRTAPWGRFDPDPLASVRLTLWRTMTTWQTQAMESRSQPKLIDRKDAARSSVDQVDLARFERLGAEWWDEAGDMAPLHRLNPTRIRFIRDTLLQHFGQRLGDARDTARPLAGLTLLDIGCGGGLLSEPLARLGARVTGIDPGPANIAVAQAHAADFGLDIDYRAVPVEVIAESDERFDVVVASEVIEHVVNQPRFVATACSLVKPGGLFVASTLNRTAKCFLLAVVGAEYVLGWLPRGTHDWRKFVTPRELETWTRRAGLRSVATHGIIFNPLRGEWGLGRDTDVNYFLVGARLTTA